MTRAAVVGKTLGTLRLPGSRPTFIAQLRRGDTDMISRPELVLETDDRVGVLAHKRPSNVGGCRRRAET